MQKSFEIDIGGIPLKIETHRWAKQSDGSAVLTYKDNVILVTANMKDEPREDGDFFPLMVDFRENTYAAGKIPGGFFKREGKPSEREILLSRLIDRPIRPLFPPEFFNDTQVVGLLLSADFSVDYDSVGIIGASAALLSSTLPFTTPLGAVKIGWKEDTFTINPGLDDIKDYDMIVQVAGTEDEVVMIEAGGNEFSEEVFSQAIQKARDIISEICRAQKPLINPDKIEIEPDEELQKILQSLRDSIADKLRDAIYTPLKLDRHTKMETLKEEILEGVDEEEHKKYMHAFHEVEYEVFRKTLLNEKRRPDGRGFEDIRDITIELGVLPRAHGSAVFTRGETQALATVTLGSEDDAKRPDDLTNDYELRKFMLHYNFPPFSVGEVAFLRGPGRREIGHGNLAYKSLLPMNPGDEDFPYTIRIVSDILESNGSSSMATVCAGSLALMHAGVPVKAPVAGIAMGLIAEGQDFAVLTDIAGFEDHFGDMDFKIAGTENGITAVQLDIKISGLGDRVIQKTLENAKNARLYILSRMKEAIPEPSKSLSQYAPVIRTITIRPDKIRDLIGPGGKTIKELVAKYGVKINAEDDGKVNIAAPNKDVGEEVIAEIKDLTATVEIGKTYKGKITRIEDYGVFVEILNGEVGLLHISEISKEHIKDIRSMNYKIGQPLEAMVINIDREGRIKLSRKSMDQKPRVKRRW